MKLPGDFHSNLRLKKTVVAFKILSIKHFQMYLILPEYFKKNIKEK